MTCQQIAKNPNLSYPHGDNILEAFSFQGITINPSDTLVLTIRKGKIYGQGPKIIELKYSGQEVIDAANTLDEELKDLYQNLIIVELNAEQVSLLNAGEYEYDWVIVDASGNKHTPADPGKITIRRVVHDA